MQPRHRVFYSLYAFTSAMNKYYYDLHIHSCLSPCGDDDSTPYNVAGMGAVAGLQIMALTDHNTCKNCPAFFKACKQYGIIAVAGMELTTAEDIHIICLFEELEDALAFSDEVEKHRTMIPNRVDIFGQQMILGEEDALIGVEEHYLPMATNLSLEQVPPLVKAFRGICYPAHIDRQANGIIATLGTLPKQPQFDCVEFHFQKNIEEYGKKYSLPKTTVVCSDAHNLGDIRDAENFFLLPDEPYSSKRVRAELFKVLRGEA